MDKCKPLPHALRVRPHGHRAYHHLGVAVVDEAAGAAHQGLTLVHLSAQLEPNSKKPRDVLVSLKKCLR